MVRLVMLLVSTVNLSGCLTSNIIVAVRADGSGTIERTAQLRPAALAELERLLAPDLAAPAIKPPLAFTRPPDNDRGWNRGLRLLSSRSLNSATTLGWSVTYQFDDVTTVDVELLPRDLGLDVLNGLGIGTLTNTRLKFAIEPLADGLERVTVRFPHFPLDPAVEPPAGWASGSGSEMAALRNVLRGARLTVAIETEQSLLRTNSPHHDGNRVTLLDLDVEQALFSRQIGMLANTPASFEDLLSAFGDLPGVTLARDLDVTLEFRDPAAQPPQPGVALPPDTEIFLAPLSSAGGRIVIGTPINVSNSPAYDNQPSFTPDGRSILFSSARRGAIEVPAVRDAQPPPSQTDIYRYDIAAMRMSRLTRTPDSEYSPVMMPDGAHFSVVRVEADGTQRLWSFTADGQTPRLVLAGLARVGYHAWIDDRTVALFVLGARGAPATLQVADLRTGVAEVVAIGIGRSLQRMPSGQISFVQQEARTGGAPTLLTVKRLDNARAPFGTSTLTGPVDGATEPDLAWMPDGSLLMAHAETLYRWRAGESGWTSVADLGALGLRAVTRLAVSPAGDRLAIVAQPR